MTNRSREAGPQKDETTGTWWFVADVGRDQDGRRKQARRRGFRTRKEAQEALDGLRVAVRSQTFVEPQRLTVGEWLDAWLDGLEVAGRRQGTIANYRRMVKNHVLPALSGVRLQALTAMHLDKLYAELHAKDNHRGATLSPRMVRYVHTIISKSLKDAERKGMVMRNVATAASPPSAKSAKAPEQRWWTPEQLRSFLSFCADDYHFALFRTAAMSGMRRGEVCGLRWEDVDLDAGLVHVRQQLVSVEHKVVVQPHPKTDHGRRSIDLDPVTVSVLRSHRKRQLEQRMAIGAGWADTGYVFTTISGDMLHPDLVSDVFRRRVLRSGLPYIRFHDLRHSHAAHLIAARRDALEISRRLGHASPAFTLAKYGHLLPKAGSEAAAAVGALVDGVTGGL